LLAAVLVVSFAVPATAAAPVNTVPSSIQTTDVNTPKSFSSAGSNAITVADGDGGNLTVTLSVTTGTLTLFDTDGLNFSAGDGSGDTTMTFEGAIADINVALNGLTFTPDVAYDGPATLTIASNDGTTTDTDQVDLGVGVNTDPVSTVPGNQTFAEDTLLTFSTATGNALAFTDADAGTGTVQVSMNAGSLDTAEFHLATTANLSLVNGNGTDSLTIRGTPTAVNTALDGLQFETPPDYEGIATITFQSSDRGFAGTGGTKSDSDQFTADATPVDDAPRNSLPTGVGTYKGVPVILNASGGGVLSAGDPDADDPDTLPFRVVLSATNGTMKLSSGGAPNVTVTAGADNSAAMTLEGTRNQINGALDGMTFTPTSGFAGQAKIAVTSTDVTTNENDTGDELLIQVDEPEETIYWGASKETLVVGSIPGAIGRADLDGGGGANLMRTGGSSVDNPTGTAVDIVGERLYWSGSPTSGSPSIFSVKLDGSDLQTFLTRSFAVSSIAIDAESRRIYWTENGKTSPPLERGHIYYTSLDAPGTIGEVTVPSSTMMTSTPRGLALDLENDRVYWANSTTQGPSGSTTRSLSYAALPEGSGGSSTLSATVGSPQGVALDSTSNRLYWTDGSLSPTAERLRYVDVNNPGDTGSALSISPLAGGGLRTAAIDRDSNRIYFLNLSSPGTVNYTGLDGSGGGATFTTASAITNSPDGLSILKRPAGTAAPSISGTLEVGSELTCGAATWASDAPGRHVYRMAKSTAFAGWTRNGTAISGAISATYTPTETGEYKCSRTGTNFAGTTTQESAAVTVVAAPTPDPTPTPDPDPDPTPDPTPDPDPTPSAPTAPTLAALASPSRDRTPTLKGTAPTNTTVRIYSTSDCSGIPLGTIASAAFASPGVSVPVSRNATTRLYAHAVDVLGQTSSCAGPVSYTHDGIAPDTEITKRPAKKTSKRKVTFKFGTVKDEDEPSFECKLDKGNWKSCKSSRKVKVGFGKHTFRVRASDEAGNQDDSPAKYSWRRVRER
jgi:hypothetical protein